MSSPPAASPHPGPRRPATWRALAAHRCQLEQQLEDLQITLAEIGQHEARCERLLAERGVAAAPAGRRVRRTTGPL